MTTHRTGLNWRKSSFSFANSNCVEVALDGGCVLVGNSRQPGGPKLVYTPDEWTAFLGGARAGEFDLDALRGALAADRPATGGTGD